MLTVDRVHGVGMIKAGEEGGMRVIRGPCWLWLTFLWVLPERCRRCYRPLPSASSSLNPLTLPPPSFSLLLLLLHHHHQRPILLLLLSPTPIHPSPPSPPRFSPLPLLPAPALLAAPPVLLLISHSVSLSPSSLHVALLPPRHQQQLLTFILFILPLPATTTALHSLVRCASPHLPPSSLPPESSA
ncbi:hypothetical protein EX30DRAFT_169311 [Ascodesmis nigricans]|uniref:Uncharacterized protein n=1 Tax=Ascodesmis nigricans TaxID=341454 RepID=A0A4S2MRS2_9PEZI|nr:hypothetical protein EX30DRAFT_169311 [Ascodesmis nigricans]